MAMVNHEEKLIREWEQRYESYRVYRSQYLTTLTIASTGGLIGAGIAFSEQTDPVVKKWILIAICLCWIMLMVAHILAMRTIKDLGNRIEFIERKLEIHDFRTTRMLEMSLWATLAASVVVFFIFVFFIWHFG